jgi:hypothetical protein
MVDHPTERLHSAMRTHCRTSGECSTSISAPSAPPVYGALLLLAVVVLLTAGWSPAAAQTARVEATATVVEGVALSLSFPGRSADGTRSAHPLESGSGSAAVSTLHVQGRSARSMGLGRGSLFDDPGLCTAGEPLPVRGLRWNFEGGAEAPVGHEAHGFAVSDRPALRPSRITVSVPPGSPVRLESGCRASVVIVVILTAT